MQARPSVTRVLVARVGGERFAFPLADVVEVAEALPIVPVALAPIGMAGQCVHRDRLLPVLDAAVLLGVPRAGGAGPAGGAGVLLLFDTDGGRVALCVDDAVDMVTVEERQWRALPASGASAAVLLSAVLHLESGIAGAVAMDALRGAMLARLMTEVG
jgi:chemotaxis signal transduction protein